MMESCPYGVILRRRIILATAQMDIATRATKIAPPPTAFKTGELAAMATPKTTKNTNAARSPLGEISTVHPPVSRFVIRRRRETNALD